MGVKLPRLAMPQMPLEFDDELVVDNFAGGGGASTGIELALGRPIDIAINHSPEAVAMHMANHPHTYHYCEDVWNVDPRRAANGRPIGLAWFSPDCRHHSKAKGGKPIRREDEKSRGLAWVIKRWCATVRPRVVMMENVEEWLDWGPVDFRTGKPIESKKGARFRYLVHCLERMGYRVEWRELVACNYGAPTSRKRLFLIARCDGRPIIWPAPTHGPGRSQPYRTAAECIDWSLPVQSIFERKRPLADNTMRRIAKGIEKFVVNDPDPFILTTNHGGPGFRGQSVREPFKTITASRDDHRLIAPFITRFAQTGRDGNPARRPDDTLSTIVTKQEHILTVPHIVKHFGGVTGIRADNPFPTTTTRGTQNQLVTSHLMTLRNQHNIGRRTDEPLLTITASGTHHAEVRAFLVKYYGAISGQHQRPDEPIHTIRTKDGYALVTVHGIEYAIVDIGMRMLTPRELFTCQGFAPDYIIDPIFNGKPLTKTMQTRCVGNSVPPQLAQALVTANVAAAKRMAA